MELLERAKLAREIYQAVYNYTETLEEWGECLAYLMGAILSEEQYVVTPHDPSTEQEFYEFLTGQFDEYHPIWEFVVEER